VTKTILQLWIFNETTPACWQAGIRQFKNPWKSVKSVTYLAAPELE